MNDKRKETIARFKACPGPGSGFCICGVCARMETHRPKSKWWGKR